MVKKLRKTIKKSLAKPETERIYPVRKKVNHWKIKEIKSLKPLSSELSNGVKKTKIRVVGIGGGAGNIISEIASKIKKATFVVANTDLKALKEVPKKVERFHFGGNLTQGLGTGMNPELGENAAQNDREKIKKLLENQDLCILIATLGGGVGSGATPIFAKIAKSLGNLTLGIFTLPFKFEGEKKMEIAKTALEKIKPRLNALIIIPNERIFQIIDKKTPLKAALSAINESLVESLEGLIEMIYEPGLINIDFADLRTILEGQGRLSYLNTVMVRKKGDVSQTAVEKVLNNPLYPYSIRGAKGILLNIAGEKDLQLAEVSRISKTISGLVNEEAKIIFGISHTRHGGGEAKYSDVIKTTLLATGCQTKIFSAKPLTKILVRGKSKKRSPKDYNPPTALPFAKGERAPKKIIEELPLTEKKPKSKPSQKSLSKKAAKKLHTPPPPSRQGGPHVKIKVQRELKEAPQPEGEENRFSSSLFAVARETEEKKVVVSNPATAKEQLRKNALQIKREMEEAEKEIEAQEKIWETPAFLRKKRTA